jgi:hypothetical protein
MGMEYYQKQGKSKGKILFIIFGTILLLILLALLIFYGFIKKNKTNSESSESEITSEETVDEETGETEVEYDNGFLSDIEVLKEINGAEVTGEIEFNDADDLLIYGDILGFYLNNVYTRYPDMEKVITLYGTYTQNGIRLYLFPFSLDDYTIQEATEDYLTQEIIINEDGVYWAVKGMAEEAEWAKSYDTLEYIYDYSESNTQEAEYFIKDKFYKIYDGESAESIIDDFVSCITTEVENGNSYFATTTEGFNALVINDMSAIQKTDNILGKDLEKKTGELKASIEVEGDTEGERFVRIMGNGESLSYVLNIKETKDFQPEIKIPEDKIITTEKYTDIYNNIIGKIDYSAVGSQDED